MASVVRLHDQSAELQARCADLLDVGGCETEHQHPQQFRCQSDAPIRKLTVDLIKTYRKINEVSE